MRKLCAAVAAIVSLSLVGTSCGRGPSDFRKAAEKAIRGADAARIIGEQFDGVVCDTPSNTAKGSTFACRATGRSSGAGYTFVATISDSSRVEITDYEKLGS